MPVFAVRRNLDIRRQETSTVRKDDSPEIGDQWVFVAIDEETKLVPVLPSQQAHQRQYDPVYKRLEELLSTKNAFKSPQTDGISTVSIQGIFAGQVDFAQLVKLFGDYGQHDSPDARYSPSATHRRLYPRSIDGRPDPDHISTCFVERQNLDHAYGDAPIYPFDERFFEEACAPESGLRFALRTL